MHRKLRPIGGHLDDPLAVVVSDKSYSPAKATYYPSHSHLEGLTPDLSAAPPGLEVSGDKFITDDDVLVTSEGSRVLTTAPRDLIVV